MLHMELLFDYYISELSDNDVNFENSYKIELMEMDDFVEYINTPNVLLIDMRPPARFKKNTITNKKNRTINLFDAMIGDYNEITDEQMALIKDAENIVIFDEESTEITKILLSYKLCEILCKIKNFEVFNIYLLKGGFRARMNRIIEKYD